MLPRRTTGKSHSFGGQYLELVLGERLRYTDKFDDPNLPGEIQVTVALKPVFCGTELNIVQEGLPDPFRWKRAISVGRTRCEISRVSSSPKSINRRRVGETRFGNYPDDSDRTNASADQ
jgi:hypothetical protein